jgi:hypothetical protein
MMWYIANWSKFKMIVMREKKKRDKIKRRSSETFDVFVNWKHRKFKQNGGYSGGYIILVIIKGLNGVAANIILIYGASPKVWPGRRKMSESSSGRSCVMISFKMDGRLTNVLMKSVPRSKHLTEWNFCSHPLIKQYRLAGIQQRSCLFN